MLGHRDLQEGPCQAQQRSEVRVLLVQSHRASTWCCVGPSQEEQQLGSGHLLAESQASDPRAHTDPGGCSPQSRLLPDTEDSKEQGSWGDRDEAQQTQKQK